MLENCSPLIAGSGDILHACEVSLAEGGARSYQFALGTLAAIATGFIDGILQSRDDPFKHQPASRQRLEVFVEELGARDWISSESWGRAFRLSEQDALADKAADAGYLGAMVIGLLRYTDAEVETLEASLICNGISGEAARAAASGTVTAGLALTLGGLESEWLSNLSQANRRLYSDCTAEAASHARIIQGFSLKRFKGIRSLDDFEAQREVCEAQIRTIRELTANFAL